MLVGLTDLPILVNGAAVDWADGAPRVEMSTFGGKLVTHSTFDGARGIVVVRAGERHRRTRPRSRATSRRSVVDGVSDLPTGHRDRLASPRPEPPRPSRRHGSSSVAGAASAARRASA